MFASSNGPADDYALMLYGEAGGAIGGSGESGLGMRMDRRDAPPHLWIRVKARRPFSLDPFVVEVLRVDGRARPKDDPSAVTVLAEHVLEPRVERHRIEASIESETFAVYAQVIEQRHAQGST